MKAELIQRLVDYEGNHVAAAESQATEPVDLPLENEVPAVDLETQNPRYSKNLSIEERSEKSLSTRRPLSELTNEIMNFNELIQQKTQQSSFKKNSLILKKPSNENEEENPTKDDQGAENEVESMAVVQRRKLFNRAVSNIQFYEEDL